MGLLDGSSEEPRSKLRRYILTGAVFALLAGLGLWCLWHVLRFHTEKKAVEQFLEALVAGDVEKAYRLWKPLPSYSFGDFLADWGPSGFYGPVKSYRIDTAQKLKRDASGVVVVVDVSPYPTFPEDSDAEKQRSTKEVRIWVESKDQSLGFSP